jgi:hypothetical protein
MSFNQMCGGAVPLADIDELVGRLYDAPSQLLQPPQSPPTLVTRLAGLPNLLISLRAAK